MRFCRLLKEHKLHRKFLNSSTLTSSAVSFQAIRRTAACASSTHIVVFAPIELKCALLVKMQENNVATLEVLRWSLSSSCEKF